MTPPALGKLGLSDYISFGLDLKEKHCCSPELGCSLEAKRPNNSR
jgi:hypothetical protein